jgi:transcription termination factor Rho
MEQINKDSSSSTHEIASLSSLAKPGQTSPEAKPKPHHEPSSMDKYFLTPRTNNLKKLKTIAKRLGLRNYSQYNSKTKSDLIKLILKEELDAGDWFNKLSRLNIKKLKSIAEKLVIKIKQNSKKTDLVNRISDNVNNENLNTVLKEIGSQSLEELLEETMSKNESTQNTTIKELRKIAKEKNIKGYSKMKKAELLQKINDQPFAFEDSYFREFSKKI